MTWAKLDDSFAEHPKVAGVSDKAFRLHVTAICYCARNLTDGEIPKAILPMLGGTPRLANELVSAGLWDTTSRGGWVVHDYLEYNPSHAEVAAAREKNRSAGRAGGQASAQARATAPAQANSKPSPVPVPVTSASNEALGVARAPTPSRRRREILEADICRWEGQRPELEIRPFVADYLNWTGSQKHMDKVQGFENQLRISWKCAQFTRSNGNGTRPNTNGRGGDPQSDPELQRLRAMGVIHE